MLCYNTAMKIATCAAVRKAEQAAFLSGATDSLALMDAVVECMWQAVQDAPELQFEPSQVVVYAGKGNNAGDALGLAARFRCPIILRAACGPHELSPDTQVQLARIPQHHLAATAPHPRPGTLIIDGLLGSGAKGALREPYTHLVQEMNNLRAAAPRSILLAVDIPTGLDADTGAAQCPSVQADVSCPIGCVKPGMLADGAENYVGRLLPIPLPGIAIEACSPDTVLTPAHPGLRIPRRAYSCFKNRAGRVNIVAGSVGYAGAAQMCAEAALAAGAGLVALYCLPDVYPILAARVAPEIMVQPVRSYADVPTTGAQAWLIGPGLGAPPAANRLALQQLILRAEGALVLDADALNLAAKLGWTLPPHAILTPHPGEMQRLMSTYVPGVQPATRRETARLFVQNCPCTLLLKGARSIITNGTHTFYNSTGGPYMACGGQGDVLAGVIAALAAQGMQAFQAATAAAHACGLAAATAWCHRGSPPSVRPTQLLEFLPRFL